MIKCLEGCSSYENDAEEVCFTTILKLEKSFVVNIWIDFGHDKRQERFGRKYLRVEKVVEKEKNAVSDTG